MQVCTGRKIKAAGYRIVPDVDTCEISICGKTETTDIVLTTIQCLQTGISSNIKTGKIIIGTVQRCDLGESFNTG